MQSVEIHKRVGAFARALGTINKCLSDAIYAMLRGRLDGDSRVASLMQSGNDILETFKYSADARFLPHFFLILYLVFIASID